jgi:acyl-ACP thioesterase
MLNNRFMSASFVKISLTVIVGKLYPPVTFLTLGIIRRIPLSSVYNHESFPRITLKLYIVALSLQVFFRRARKSVSPRPSVIFLLDFEINLINDQAKVPRDSMKNRHEGIQRVWNESFLIRSYDIDSEGLAALPALCRFMQEAALNHAAHLGIGLSHLRVKDLLWVLARQRITIHQFPRLAESITIRTEPTGKDRLFCYRDFAILDGAGRTIGAAHTVWFIMGRRDKKPRRPDSYFTVRFGDGGEGTVPTKLRKLPEPMISGVPSEIRVTYRDLDMNEHVNNIRYIEWIIDSFPLEFMRAHALEELEINYVAEALYGDLIFLGREDREDLVFLHRLTRAVDDARLCRARTSWIRRRR